MLVEANASVQDGRINNLIVWLNNALQSSQAVLEAKGNIITVKLHGQLICTVDVIEEGYRIRNVSSAWAGNTTYCCESAEDGTWYYDLDPMDACIGEVKALISFETHNGSELPSGAKKGTSELRSNVTASVFEMAFVKFMEQAKKNAASKKSQGSQIPHGFSGKATFDGADFHQNFGQGNASKTPYMNWWAVSIYYLVESGRIILGIEKDRYPHLNKMNPCKVVPFVNKKKDVAVFYETTTGNLDYDQLYHRFIETAEEVMELGLT